MEAIIPHMGNPMPSMIFVELEHASVSFAQVPYPDCPICSTRGQRVQLVRVVVEVEDLVGVGVRNLERAFHIDALIKLVDRVAGRNAEHIRVMRVTFNSLYALTLHTVPSLHNLGNQIPLANLFLTCCH